MSFSIASLKNLLLFSNYNKKIMVLLNIVSAFVREYLEHLIEITDS
ncbi:conserved hypothetical protein [Carnobacterium maltaromaticum]|nr:conserved hypothetical protein [Carnobacterium maltaromaticum]